MRLRLLYCVALAAALALPAEPDLDALVRIERIRVQMSENLARLPNYTCTQTIERSRRRARGRRFELLDTLRLEVALVNGKELFAWPGSGKFEDRELSEIVGGGTSGNGNFALHARAVFLGGAARFTFLGEVETEDRRVYQYEYQVPRAASGYKLRVDKAEGLAGYGGRFEADVNTLDVVALDVIAVDIPSHIPLKEATARMRYRRMQIGSGDFLLPEGSELGLTDLDGNESRNVVHLSGCKQYGTESVISFAEAPSGDESPAAASVAPSSPPAPPPVAGPKSEIEELPAGLVFETSLETSLRFPGAAIGDPIEARVVSDAKKKGAVMIPKGSTARGRLVGFRPLSNARLPTLSVSIVLNELELPGGLAKVRGVIDRTTPAGLSGVRMAVDDRGVLFLSGGTGRILAKGTRFWWRLETVPTPPAATPSR